LNLILTAISCFSCFKKAVFDDYDEKSSK